MADNGFNGTTFTFGGTVIDRLRSLSYSDSANEVDVTSLDNTAHTYVTGIPDVELSVECVGFSVMGINRGDTGTIQIDWNDGSQDVSTIAYLCTSRETSGDLDGEITTSVTFKPTTSAA